MDNNLKSIICSLNDFKSGEFEFYSYTKNSSYIELKNIKTNSIIKIEINNTYDNNDSPTSTFNTEPNELDVSATSVMDDVLVYPIKNTQPVMKPLETSETSETCKNNDIIGGAMFSDTSSVLNKKGGAMFSDTSSELYKKGGFYSETSNLEQNGGYNASDTLNSISELQIRKKQATQSTQLDLNIFKKTNNMQNGGANKNKLKAIGINSSSTSSMCG